MHHASWQGLSEGEGGLVIDFRMHTLHLSAQR